MHRLFAALFVASIATSPLLAACGSSANQVEVKGPESDLAGLAGEWNGNYAGVESGRNGTIKFTLELGSHTADGQVFMGGSDVPLAISFVQVEHGKISGKIQPYTDPSCSCEVETEFLGDVESGRIDGTFTTKVIANGAEQHGTWNVVRN